MQQRVVKILCDGESEACELQMDTFSDHCVRIDDARCGAAMDERGAREEEEQRLLGSASAGYRLRPTASALCALPPPSPPQRKLRGASTGPHRL